MTQNATIEIQARPIKGLEATGAHHLFIIYKDSQGQKTILRGGPERDGLMPMGIDDIRIIRAPYVKEYEHLFPNDLIEKAPSVVIAKGTDAETKIYIDKMWAKAEEINSQGFDYKLPTPFCKADVCHVQNSNTVIRALVEYADLEFKLPQIDGKDVWVPGVDGEFKHTSIDDVMHKIWAFNTSLQERIIENYYREIMI